MTNVHRKHEAQRDLETIKATLESARADYSDELRRAEALATSATSERDVLHQA